MKEYWPLEASDENRIYTFLSRGPKGDIKMMIQFTSDIAEEVFILAFGNQKSDNTLDYIVINNNGDRNKIIATVIKAVHEFTDYYPDAFVFFSGSSNGRNRLYRAAISTYLQSHLSKFNIWGLKEDGQFELFEKDKSYSGFIIKTK